jgi:hypothetical protein
VELTLKKFDVLNQKQKQKQKNKDEEIVMSNTVAQFVAIGEKEVKMTT